MLERFLVFASIIALIAFCGVVVGYVAEPDLVIVVILMLALASHDFWISVFRPSDHSEPPPPTTVSLESLPTGVSGKPATRKKAPARKKSRRRAASAGK